MNRQPILDALSAIIGRQPTPQETDAMHAAVAQAEASIPASPPAPPTTTGAAPPAPASTQPAAKPAGLAFGSAGAALVKHFEGCARAQGNGTFAAYPDPGTGGKPWTIGWGTTGADVVPGLIWTQAQCDARFDVDSAKFAAQVAKLIGNAPTTQHQFDAIVCLTYNIGLGNLAASTLLKKHVAGDTKGAAAEFAKWNKANHKVLNGLVARRAAEAALYATPDAAPPPTIG